MKKIIIIIGGAMLLLLALTIWCEQKTKKELDQAKVQYHEAMEGLNKSLRNLDEVMDDLNRNLAQQDSLRH